MSANQNGASATLNASLIQVSPHFTLDTDTSTVTEYPDCGEARPYEFDDETLPAKIFRDRVTGWFFDVAVKLLQEGQDVAAVHLVTPLIEALEERVRGEPSTGHSEDFFTASAQRILNLTDQKGLKLLYGGLRCGFAHHGFLKDDAKQSNILLTRDLTGPVVYVDTILWVDVPQYVDAVRGAYEEYYNDLTDPDKKTKFLRLWAKDWQMSLRVPGAGGSIPVPGSVTKK
ncbi:MAG: hypothetical protein WBW81_01585 [Methylocella sp.]